MLDRSTFSELEVLFAKNGSNSERTVRTAMGLKIMIEIIILGIGAIKLLWDGGFGDIVDSLPTTTSSEPTSRYTRRWWKTAQAIYAIFYAVLNIPISNFVGLVFLDTKGEIVVDANGTPVRPFALFDPAHLGDLGLQTITKFTASDPEASTEPEAEPTTGGPTDLP